MLQFLKGMLGGSAGADDAPPDPDAAPDPTPAPPKSSRSGRAGVPDPSASEFDRPEPHPADFDAAEVDAVTVTRPHPAPSKAAARPDLDTVDDGPIDFARILDLGGFTPAQERLTDRGLELLSLLPRGTSPTVSRAIVALALEAFDVPMAGVARAGAARVNALYAYVGSRDRVKQRLRADADARIVALEREIEAVRLVTTRKIAAQQAIEDATRRQLAQVEPVLEFFVRAALTSFVAETRREPGSIEDEAVDYATPAPLGIGRPAPR